MGTSINTVVPQEPNGGQQIEAVEETQAPQMPSEEQKPTESGTELPADASERTKLEFEKLKSHNKEMADKLRTYEQNQYGKSVFDSILDQGGQAQPNGNFPNVPFERQQEVAQSFVDANGYVDTEAIARSLKELNDKANRAEHEAKAARETIRQGEEGRQIQEAHKAFPWLNPANKDQFDPQGFELVRDRILRNMVNGNQQSLAQVAEDITRFYKPTANTAELQEQAVNEYKEKQAVKAQASSVQSGKGQPRQEANLSDLRERTQRGDESALDERLRHI
jgi:hypothetical protein